MPFSPPKRLENSLGRRPIQRAPFKLKRQWNAICSRPWPAQALRQHDPSSRFARFQGVLSPTIGAARAIKRQSSICRRGIQAELGMLTKRADQAAVRIRSAGAESSMRQQEREEYVIERARKAFETRFQGTRSLTGPIALRVSIWALSLNFAACQRSATTTSATTRRAWRLLSNLPWSHEAIRSTCWVEVGYLHTTGQD